MISKTIHSIRVYFKCRRCIFLHWCDWSGCVSRSLYPIIKLLGKNASIKSTELAKAMFTFGLNGAEKQILENKDILDQKKNH